MAEMLVSTNPDWVLTSARFVIGITFFAHGAQNANSATNYTEII